jgi:Spy/CpxP family protein refolding chaperone
MRAQSIKGKALLFAIFFIGIATGVLLANFYTTRVSSRDGSPPARAQGDINKFYDYLGLNDEQREQMHKIGEETRQEFQNLRTETQPRFQLIQEQSRAKIRAVLNDEQRAKYDEFRKDRDERRRNHGGDENKHDREPRPDHAPRPN